MLDIFDRFTRLKDILFCLRLKIKTFIHENISARRVHLRKFANSRVNKFSVLDLTINRVYDFFARFDE